ncbi:MAG: 3-isopropylmalate dehydratase small subunit [Rhodospirillaceae bacterium]|nr:3-isopropylmalate dehydratase small subunit [Rhodospirillaceae bacterium]|tara:strand:+ start:280 stop:855 length:576 start_codon:yes stop_codon:yes gene_type:complete
MEAIKTITSRTVVLPLDDIDTDQIIPARFLRTTVRAGLGKNLFTDWRYNEDGSEIEDFVLNKPESKEAEILVAGRNFGCGSSREHAPWALLDQGFRAVISTEIADIFRNNSLKNGFIPVVITEQTHQWLLANPGAEISLDIEHKYLVLPDGRKEEFPLENFSRYCLLNGIDQLGFLMDNDSAISSYEDRML